MSSTSIFGQGTAPVPQATRLGTSVITLPSSAGALVVFQAQFEYSRDSSIINPLNLTKRILTVSEPKGTLILQMVVGPDGSMGKFLKEFADECKISDQGSNITIHPVSVCKQDDGSNTRGDIRWVFKGLLLTGIQGSLNRNSDTGNLVLPVATFSFTDMEIDDGG